MELSKCQTHYRLLQVIHNGFKCCYYSIVLPFMFLTLLIINVISNYATMCMYYQVKLPGYLGFPLTSAGTMMILLDTIPSSYNIYVNSERLINTTLERTRGNGESQKFLSTCKPLCVRVGSYFVVKQNTIMAFICYAVDNTINLLLTF